MHIVHCLTHSTIGGGQQVVYLLIKAFQKKYPETRITVILPSGGIYVERFKMLGLQIIEFPFDRISWINLIRIVKILQKLEPDVIHSHGKGAGLYTRFLPKYFLNVKNIHSYHGFHPPMGLIPRILYLWSESMLLKKTDCVVNVSVSEQEFVNKMFNLRPNKSVVINNVIDAKSIVEESNTEVPEQIRAFLNNPENKFIVIMIGRNDPIKNFPLAIETAQLIMKEKRSVAFLLVGLNKDDKLIQPLLKQFPGRVAAVGIVKNTPPLIKHSHLLLITSKREAFGMVILEAHALGKPVVGTRVPGISENIKHYQNGILCDESPRVLADAISLLENDQTLYEKMQRSALRAAATMNVDVWVTQYQELYLNLFK